MCPFKAGDVIRNIGSDSLYWFINDNQYVSLEQYTYGKREGHQGMYLSDGASKMIWNGYVKICNIDELRRVLLKVELC